MSSDLAEAAKSGDKKQLTELFDACQNTHKSDLRCCFLPQGEGENIFHLSGRNNRVEFFKKAIRILPEQLVHELLIQPEPTRGGNPLHVAAQGGNLEIVELILDFYDKLRTSDKVPLLEHKPWVALDNDKRTPLHLGLNHSKDECVMKMISKLDNNDIEVICNMADKEGNTLLVMAVSKGCNQVARHLLTHVSSHNLSAKNEDTLINLVRNSSGEVFALLLDKHPEYKEKVDYKVFQEWAKAGKLWPWEYLLNTVRDTKSKSRLVNFIYNRNNLGNNIFHHVAKGRKFEAAKTLAKVYRDDKEINPDVNVPWLVANKQKVTPLDYAMANCGSANDEYKQLKERIIVNSMVTQGKTELLFVAIEKQLYRAAEGLSHVRNEYGWSLYPTQGGAIWDAALEHSEKAAIWVAEKILVFSQDEFVEHSLCSASKNDKAEFVKWMLKKNSNALKVAPLSWVKACEKGHISTIKAFINCTGFVEHCREKKDTPFHHIQLNSYEQYQDILKNEVMLRLINFQDINDQTPLHKAVENKRNLPLAKILLSMDDVFRSNKKDKWGQTTMDLLDEACKSSEWDDMCKQLGIVPGMKMTYFHGKLNLLEVRNTLSVVAVLLATITFTAGFTLPGGVRSDTTGKATLGNKAAFLVFMTTDALAMCSSMLVLVCLIWSMLCDEYHITLILMNGSVPLLILALYGTLFAFLTGVYIVIPHKSAWICIVILVMCFIFVILSMNGVMTKLLILFKKVTNYELVLNKLRSDRRRRSKDKIDAMERGEASNSEEGDSSWIHSIANLGDINSQQQKSE